MTLVEQLRREVSELPFNDELVFIHLYQTPHGNQFVRVTNEREPARHLMPENMEIAVSDGYLTGKNGYANAEELLDAPDFEEFLA